LYFLVDTALGWRYKSVGRSGALVMIASTLWLVTGIAAWALSRDRDRFLRKAAKPILGLFACVLSVVLGEAMVRTTGRDGAPALFRPSKYVLTPAPEFIPGVEGQATITFNEVGLRGPALPAGNAIYKIIAVGGSTTQCFYLDDSETWPSLAMTQLNQQQRLPVWVGNAGVNGHTCAHHLAVLRSVPVLSQAQMLVFLLGANDMQEALATSSLNTEQFERRTAAFAQYLEAGHQQPYPRYKHLAVFQLARKFWLRQGSAFGDEGIVEYPNGAHYVERRRMRAAGPFLPVPHLRDGLKQFGACVSAIASECQARGLRCLFLTHPSMWRADLEPAAESLLWLPFVGSQKAPQGYLTTADAARVMDAWNRELLAVCRQQGLECQDLAAAVPKDRSAFYDDLHLTERGAQVVARFLGDYLLSTPPFVPAPSSESSKF